MTTLLTRSSVLLSVVALLAGCASSTLERSTPPAPAAAADATTGPLEDAAVDFLRDAIQARRLGIAVARLAARRATTAEIRRYAANSIGQQELIRNRLDQIAQRYDVGIGQGLGEEGQKTLADLRGKPRGAFDDALLDYVIKDRTEAVRACEFAGTLANIDVRTFGVEFRDGFQQQVDEAEAKRKEEKDEKAASEP